MCPLAPQQPPACAMGLLESVPANLLAQVEPCPRRETMCLVPAPPIPPPPRTWSAHPLSTFSHLNTSPPCPCSTPALLTAFPTCLRVRSFLQWHRQDGAGHDMCFSALLWQWLRHQCKEPLRLCRDLLLNKCAKCQTGIPTHKMFVESQGLVLLHIYNSPFVV